MNEDYGYRYERLGNGDAWRQAIEVSARYYEDWARLTADWLLGVSRAGEDLWERDRTPRPDGYERPDRYERAGPQTQPRSRARASSVGQPALLLEGEPGEEAKAVFLVDNGLAHPVNAPVQATEFADAAGAVVLAPLRFDPPTVQLAPGEQVLVQVTTVIPPDAVLNHSYRSELSVPGLAGTRVGLVMRRRAFSQPAPAEA